MPKFTKIVATISDQRCEVDFIQKLYDEGLNVVRMNSAHLKEEGFLKIINNVRAVSKEIALLIDTKGPEVRSTVAEGGFIEIKTNDLIKIIGNPEQISTKECISVNYPHFVRDLKIGDEILFDDGEIELVVINKTDEYLICKAGNDGKIGSNKSVNVPGVRINLPALTERDKKNILFAIEQKLDFIAHSFVRNKQDLINIQAILDQQKSDIKIISKIENQEGVDNIDEILEHCYGVMIARGDLGIEVPQEKLPGIQRDLIRKCVIAKKPVIVATQMLHSMIEHPRPTRAEVTDIANAIYYRTDALMLSGETAYGKYPVEALQTMARIAEETEKTKLPENDIRIPLHNNVSSFLARSAVEASTEIEAKAILTDSYTGTTARNLSAFRAKKPLFARCYTSRLSRELALSYGIFPSYQPKINHTQDFLHIQVQELIDQNVLTSEDYICNVGGSYGEKHGATFLEIVQVATILEKERKG